MKYTNSDYLRFFTRALGITGFRFIVAFSPIWITWVIQMISGTEVAIYAGDKEVKHMIMSGAIFFISSAFVIDDTIHILSSKIIMTKWMVAGIVLCALIPFFLGGIAYACYILNDGMINYAATIKLQKLIGIYSFALCTLVRFMFILEKDQDE